MNNKFFRVMSSAFLLTLLLVSIATPALAFDGREGDTVLIGSDQTINDDLYVGANNFTLDGVVNGDVVAGGAILTINGTVNGDVIAAGQAVIINGTVTHNVRIAGGTLLIGEKATIGGDVIAAGGSLEVRRGSSVARDLVFAGGQAQLAGEITRNVNVAGGGLEIRGAIGGNASVSVGDKENAGPGPAVYMPNSPIPLPNVQPGLTIDPEAKIKGSFEYVSAKDAAIPDGVVFGAVKRIQPTVAEQAQKAEPAIAEKVATGLFDMFRNMVTLFLVGMLMVWLFPGFLKNVGERVLKTPLPAFGWGLVSWVAFFFGIILILVAMVLGGIIFGVLTLGGLSGSIVWIGLLAIFSLIVGFVLASAFVSKIVVAILGGQVILSRIKPEWAEHKIWPLALGVVMFAILSAIPLLGGLVNLLVVLLGLGALWMVGRDLLQNGRAATEITPAA